MYKNLIQFMEPDLPDRDSLQWAADESDNALEPSLYYNYKYPNADWWMPKKKKKNNRT